jgi:hypothetical protein
MITPGKAKNSYLDNNPVRNFNNNYNAQTDAFSFNNAANSSGKDYMSKQSMIQYATNGSKPTTSQDFIKVVDNAVGQRLVTDTPPTGQGAAFNTTTTSPSTFGF